MHAYWRSENDVNIEHDEESNTEVRPRYSNALIHELVKLYIKSS
jgi:hypothetical protein